MAIDPHGFTDDYTGRTVDLSLIRVFPVSPNDAYPLIIPEPGGELATGVEKAAQQWLVHFLTRRGTVIGDPQYGTEFMTLLMQRTLRNEMDVTQAFAEAVQSINSYTSALLTGTEPPDEVIVNAQLLDGWDVTPDTLKLRIGLTTQAGATREVVLTTPVVIK